MPDVMFTGPEGRLEGRYHQSKEEHAPIALILHPHPQYGGTMNHKVVFSLFHVFVNRGFSVLRFNTRGGGRSQGRLDNGMGELRDARGRPAGSSAPREMRSCRWPTSRSLSRGFPCRKASPSNRAPSRAPTTSSMT